MYDNINYDNNYNYYHINNNYFIYNICVRAWFTFNLDPPLVATIWLHKREHKNADILGKHLDVDQVLRQNPEGNPLWLNMEPPSCTITISMPTPAQKWLLHKRTYLQIGSTGTIHNIPKQNLKHECVQEITTPKWCYCNEIMQRLAELDAIE